MKNSNVLNKLPDFFLAQLLSFSFVLALTTSLGLTYPFLGTYLLILAVTTLSAIALANRQTLLAAGLLTGLILLAAAYIVIFKTGFDKLYNFLDNYFYWLADFIENFGEPDRLYQFITVICLCIVISLVIYIFTVKKMILYIPLIIGTAIFTIQWSFGLTSTLLPFYLFLPAILMFYFKHIHKKKSAASPNEYVGPGYFTLWTIPICVIALILAVSFHANENPLQWKWLDNKINSISNYFNKKFYYEAFDYFSVSSSGFGSKDDILGGRVRLNKTSVLSVTTPRNVYLKGATKDIYTGSKWISGSIEKIQIGKDFSSLYEDTDEMVTGLKLLTPDKDYLDKLFFKDRVSITFQNLKTKSVFVPSKTIAITPAEKNFMGITDANGSLSSSERLAKGFSYSVDLYSPKVGSEEFTKVLRNSYQGLYLDKLKDLESSGFLSSPASSAANTAETPANPQADTSDGTNNVYIVKIIDYAQIEMLNRLSEAAKAVEQKYVQLPDNLPQRVRDLAVSITGSAQNQYDKVKAIEKYLSSNFPYNLDVRTTPRNRDFVDYFLFDLKEGYCTYYSSAMTVLARCAGIPARYVEGYILPPGPVKEGSDSYNVTNMQAHAWTEVYFEGYGWLPFEPTSPFRSNYYSDGTISASISTSYSPTFQEYMDLVRRYGQTRGIVSTDDMLAAEAEKTEYFPIVLLIAGSLILIFIAVLLANLLRSKLRLFRILNLPPKDCILKLYEYFIRILSLQGLELQSGETPLQYSSRVDMVLFFDPVKFKTITDVFVKCRYGMYESNDKEKQLACDFISAFMGETRDYMGKPRFILMKWILGRI